MEQGYHLDRVERDRHRAAEVVPSAQREYGERRLRVGGDETVHRCVDRPVAPGYGHHVVGGGRTGREYADVLVRAELMQRYVRVGGDAVRSASIGWPTRRAG